jgi:hypothetical protein
MDEQRPHNPLDYADPERQTPPRFGIHWGGWVLLAMLLSYFLAAAADWLLHLSSRT